ncbi:MAG: hypothetical protein ACODAE_05315 [Gemmatimonadota bacterium]
MLIPELPGSRILLYQDSTLLALVDGLAEAVRTLGDGATDDSDSPARVPQPAGS